MMRRVMVTVLVVAGVFLGGTARADHARVTPTEYTGYYYKVNPDTDKRDCVVWRESRDRPGVTNGRHHGLYQFTPMLAEGAAWMMRADPVEPITKRQRVWLQATPMREWPRYWQDRAFYTVYNYAGPGSGAKHWHLDGSSCNGLVR